MAKKITAFVKLALAAGKATPAPPVGPAFRSTWFKYCGIL